MDPVYTAEVSRFTGVDGHVLIADIVLAVLVAQLEYCNTLLVDDLIFISEDIYTSPLTGYTEMAVCPIFFSHYYRRITFL